MTVGVNASGTEQESARPKGEGRTSPTPAEYVAPTRLRSGAASPIERHLHRIFESYDRCDHSRKTPVKSDPREDGGAHMESWKRSRGPGRRTRVELIRLQEVS